MLIIYQAVLPQAYLLVLASSSAAPAESELAPALARAARCGRPAVWLDCRLLDELSAPAGRLLRRLHHCLYQRQAQLVLCRVSDGLARSLHATGAVPETGFTRVGSLDEAADYTRSYCGVPAASTGCAVARVLPGSFVTG